MLIRADVVMTGYRNLPDKTAEAIDADGWLHTGDIGEIDEDGYLTIVDRKKELIINAAGKNMSPANIEAALKGACPLIGQACVIGDGRSYNTALIVLDADFAPAWAAQHGIEDTSLEALARNDAIRAAVQEGVDKANDKLARVEQIKKFTIVEGDWLPGGDELTPTMKLKRKPIAEKYASEIEAMYGADASGSRPKGRPGGQASPRRSTSRARSVYGRATMELSREREDGTAATTRPPEPAGRARARRRLWSGLRRWATRPWRGSPARRSEPEEPEVEARRPRPRRRRRAEVAAARGRRASEWTRWPAWTPSTTWPRATCPSTGPWTRPGRPSSSRSRRPAAPAPSRAPAAAIPARPFSPSGVMALQRLVGNAAVAGMIADQQRERREGPGGLAGWCRRGGRRAAVAVPRAGSAARRGRGRGAGPGGADVRAAARRRRRRAGSAGIVAGAAAGAASQVRRAASGRAWREVGAQRGRGRSAGRAVPRVEAAAARARPTGGRAAAARRAAEVAAPGGRRGGGARRRGRGCRRGGRGRARPARLRWRRGRGRARGGRGPAAARLARRARRRSAARAARCGAAAGAAGAAAAGAAAAAVRGRARPAPRRRRRRGCRRRRVAAAPGRPPRAAVAAAPRGGRGRARAAAGARPRTRASRP